MQVKKFEASSLDEALLQVKHALGPDALILSTQQKKNRWFHKPIVEVTVAFEPPKPVPAKNLEQVFDDRSLVEIFPHRRARMNDDEPPTSRPLAIEKSRHVRYVDIPGSKRPNPQLRSIEDRLLILGVSQSLAKDLSSQLLFEYPPKDLAIGPMLEKAIARMLADRVKCVGESGLLSAGEWVAVGLSGGGRTTLLVKLSLAARQRSRSTALVGLDGCRLMGRETLQKFSRLIHCPFYSEKTFQRSNESIKYIDCPSLPIGGTSEEWEQFERCLQGKRTFLVVDATMRLKEAERLTEQVIRFSPAGIVLTKVDLVLELGPMFELLRTTKLPLMGISMAQSFKVPIRFLDEKEFSLLVVRRGVFE